MRRRLSYDDDDDNDGDPSVLQIMMTVEKLKAYTRKLKRGEEQWTRRTLEFRKQSAFVRDTTKRLRSKAHTLRQKLVKINSGKESCPPPDDVSQNTEDDDERTSIRNWSNDQVVEWIRLTLKMEDVARAFQAEEINGFMLVQLNDRQLEQIGVSEESRRNLILSAVNTELGIRREILEETSSMNACVDSAENVDVGDE